MGEAAHIVITGGFQIMLSEWMEEVPDDLEENWVVKMVPVGKRMLVVSNRGWTTAFYRNGYCAGRFPSALPGKRCEPLPRFFNNSLVHVCNSQNG